MKILISVVIPIYNSEKFLSRAIESVVNQTYENIEIILINDGSTDNSLEVCKEYEEKDKRIKVINKKNSGVSDTRNYGIENSTGQYIMFMDSDDYIDKDMIKDMTDKIDEKTELVISGIKMKYVENEKIVKEKEYTLKDNVYNVNQFLNAMLLDFELICFCGPCCKLYKRDNLINNKIRFSKDLTMGEDTWYNLDYIDICNGDIVTLSNIYYNYMRENKESLFSKYYIDYIKTTEKVYNKFLNILRKKANKQTVERYEKMYVINLIYANSINFKYRTDLKKKLSDLKYSLNNEVIKNNIKSIKADNIKEKIFIFLIKNKLKILLYLFFEINNIRRK